MNEILVELFRHHTWANLALLDFCVALPQAQTEDGALGGVYGSVRDTFYHLTRAQQGYLSIFGRADRPADEPVPGLPELRGRLQRDCEAYEALAAEATPDMVQEVAYGGVTRRIPIATVLLQAINHGTDHRSQIATVLSQHGIEPPDLDGWVYSDAHGLTTQV